MVAAAVAAAALQPPQGHLDIPVSPWSPGAVATPSVSLPFTQLEAEESNEQHLAVSRSLHCTDTMETPPPAAAPSLPTPAEFETVVAALQSTDSSNRQQAQQLLQRLQQQQEDCTGFCLTVIEAARDPAVATVAAVLLRSAGRI